MVWTGGRPGDSHAAPKTAAWVPRTVFTPGTTAVAGRAVRIPSRQSPFPALSTGHGTDTPGDGIPDPADRRIDGVTPDRTPQRRLPAATKSI